MRTANVKITEMNAGESKSVTFDFNHIDELVKAIDDTVDNWVSKDNVRGGSFEVIVRDDEQFTEEELDILEDNHNLIGY